MVWKFVLLIDLYAIQISFFWRLSQGEKKIWQMALKGIRLDVLKVVYLVILTLSFFNNEA